MICFYFVLAVPDFIQVAVSSYGSSGLGYSYFVGLIVVIVTSLPHYCAMDPSITIFPLDSYSRSYRKKGIISGSIIFCLSFVKCLMVVIIIFCAYWRSIY